MAAGRAGGLAVVILRAACLVLQLGFISCVSQQIFGIVNKSVTFYPSGSVLIKEIMWRKGKDKVIEWDGENSEPKAYPPFINRVRLNVTSGSLTILNVTSLDEDEYEVDFLSNTKTKFYLQVLEPLPSPTLNCTLTAEDITVHCRVPESYSNHRSLTTYSWNCFSVPCQNSYNASEVSIKRENDLSQEVQCSVSNPLSTQTSSLVLATCVPGNSRVHFVTIPAVLVITAVAVLLLCSKGRLKCCRQDARTKKEARATGILMLCAQKPAALPGKAEESDRAFVGEGESVPGLAEFGVWAQSSGSEAWHVTVEVASGWGWGDRSERIFIRTGADALTSEVLKKDKFKACGWWVVVEEQGAREMGPGENQHGPCQRSVGSRLHIKGEERLRAGQAAKTFGLIK